MATDVEIANQALLMLGQKTIQDLAEDTPEALAVRTYYDTSLEHTLRDIKPSFAVKRSASLALAFIPEFGFDFAYALPQDSEIVIDINHDDLGEQQFREWRIEGDNILTDRGQIKVLYIFNDATIEALMDGSYVKALAAYLAYEMSYTLTESSSKLDAMLKLYLLRADDARATYGLESSTVRTRNDQLTIVRSGGTGFGGPGNP